MMWKQEKSIENHVSVVKGCLWNQTARLKREEWEWPEPFLVLIRTGFAVKTRQISRSILERILHNLLELRKKNKVFRNPEIRDHYGSALEGKMIMNIRRSRMMFFFQSQKDLFHPSASSSEYPLLCRMLSLSSFAFLGHGIQGWEGSWIQEKSWFHSLRQRVLERISKKKRKDALVHSSIYRLNDSVYSLRSVRLPSSILFNRLLLLDYQSTCLPIDWWALSHSCLDVLVESHFIWSEYWFLIAWIDFFFSSSPSSSLLSII